MRIQEIIKESINPDIMDPRFVHEQHIGDYTYRAFYKENSGNPKLRIECFDGKKRIAFVTFAITGDALVSDVTYTFKKYREQGIASTMYAYAKMLGNDIAPSPEKTDQGEEMWNAWDKSGASQHLSK